jgi:hypothetical protein
MTDETCSGQLDSDFSSDARLTVRETVAARPA